MNRGDRLIYIQQDGKMQFICPAKGLTTNANFVIQWQHMDWSGFRTLAECEAQFPELEAKDNAKKDYFTVIER